MRNNFININLGIIAAFFIAALLSFSNGICQAFPNHKSEIPYYSYLSKCNILFQQMDGNHARIVIAGKENTGTIKSILTGKNRYGIYSNEKLLCTYYFDEESLFVLNNQYQYRCEDAKLIQLSVLHDTTIDDGFINYFQNHDYIIKDTIAIVAKAAVMNRNQDYSFSLALLNQLILKYPNNGIAYLYLSDAFNGLKRKSEAAKAYFSYKRILLGSGRSMEYRPY